MCKYIEHDTLYTSDKAKILKLKLSPLHAIKVVCEGIAPPILILDNRRSRVISFTHRSIIHVENVRIHTEYGVDETQSRLPLQGIERRCQSVAKSLYRLTYIYTAYDSVQVFYSDHLVLVFQ
jgi:hypothetical protein